MEAESLLIRVLAIKPRDAELTCAHLRDAGIHAECVDTFDALVTALGGPTGALMVTEEAVPGDGWQRLRTQFATQPAWSDLPVVVFSRRRQEGLEALIASSAGNITVIETPVRITTVISAARAALRARKRQYELRNVLHRLEEADRRKDEFLAMLGHELRNPLAAVQMAVQLKQLQSPAMAADRQMQIIQRQLSNLGHIVDDLLDVSRVTMGKIQLSKADIDLRDAASRCVQALAGEAERSQLELRLETPAAPVTICGDTVRVEQILANLVTNAIKYTPAGGRIDVIIRRDGDRARVIVRDTGIGIDAETIPHVFNLFAQAKQGLERARGGLGLGLALVKKLVEFHGGEVSAASEGLRRGSTFTVVFPAVDPATERRPRAPTPVPAGTHRLHILIVEDNDDARITLRDILTHDGHRVTEAGDGLAGIQAAMESQPEVMLVDIGLPKIDGHQVARHIRSSSGASPWMIAMTGYGQPADRERAMEVGFDRFIVKPIDVAELKRALANCVADRHRLPPGGGGAF